MPRNDLLRSGENAGDWQLVVSLIVKVCKDWAPHPFCEGGIPRTRLAEDFL